MLHHTPQVLSPLSEMDPHNSSNLRARKMSTGGNRSWSEEEVWFFSLEFHAHFTDIVIGELSPPNPHAEDAL